MKIIVTLRAPRSSLAMFTDRGGPIAATTSHSVISRPTGPGTAGPAMGGPAGPAPVSDPCSAVAVGAGAVPAHAPCASTRSPGPTGLSARVDTGGT